MKGGVLEAKEMTPERREKMYPEVLALGVTTAAPQIPNLAMLCATTRGAVLEAWGSLFLKTLWPKRVHM